MTRQNVNIGGRSVSFPNYDESVFLTPGPLSDDDAELEAIWKREHSLKEIVDRKNFKSYEELKRRLDDVLGLANAGNTNASTVKARGDIEDSEEVPFTDPKPVARKAAPVVEKEEEEEDPDLKQFLDLLND
jgi:hypothetical protein